MANRITKIRLKVFFVAIFLLVATVWMFHAPSGMFSAVKSLEERFTGAPHERWDEAEWMKSTTILVNQILDVQNSFDSHTAQASKGNLDADQIRDLEDLVTRVKALKTRLEDSIEANGLK